MNVPICTGVTALTLYSWDVVILEFGQDLWFGNRVETSLINLNQCQKFGIKICNDETDPHRNLGIEASEDLFIAIKMEGSTCGIVTHPPTDDELRECQNIILSDKFDWCPSKNLFEISSMEEEYRTSSNLHRYINFLIADYHAHLKRSSVEMNRKSMSLIEQWKKIPLEWLRT